MTLFLGLTIGTSMYGLQTVAKSGNFPWCTSEPHECKDFHRLRSKETVFHFKQNKTSHSGKLVVFTALFGDLDNLRRQPQEDGVDYLCFTDRKKYAMKEEVLEGWKIVSIERLPGLDGRRMNRHVKLLPHLYLRVDVTRSLYIDGTIDLAKKPSVVFQFFLPPGQDYNFGHCLHPQQRRNWKEEIHAAIRSGRGDKELLIAQKKAYEHRKISLYAWKGLWANYVLARRHSPQMRAFSELWWNELVEYSERDQIGLAAALHEDTIAHKKYRVRQRRVACDQTDLFRRREHSLYEGSAVYQHHQNEQIPYTLNL